MHKQCYTLPERPAMLVPDLPPELDEFICVLLDKNLVGVSDWVTRKVLHDPRVNGFEVEARGHFTAPGQFLVDPQHTRALS